MKELKILKLDYNPIEYPPQNIISCPPEMSQDTWLNRLKEFLKKDEKNRYSKINNNENKVKPSKSLESYIREAASLNDCDILCDTYFRNVPRLTHDIDKLDPWVYYFVESARNLIYAVAQLCRAIKQYSPAIENPKINELFEKEYGDVNRKVCQIIYSLDRFDRGISEASLHRRLCSDLKLIVMTTIPDVKKLLIAIQSNLKLLMESTNIRVSRNFLFTCHSIIVEVHAATESVLMAIPASERNFNPSSSSVSIPSTTNHKSTVENSQAIPINNNTNATITTTTTNNNNNNNQILLKTTMSCSPNDLSISLSTSQTSNSSMKNIYQNQKLNSEISDPMNITSTSFTEYLTGIESTAAVTDGGSSSGSGNGTVTGTGTGSYVEGFQSYNITQTTSNENGNNINSNLLSNGSYPISKQTTLPENTQQLSQLSQHLNIETQKKSRKNSLTNSIINSTVQETASDSNADSCNNSTINGNKTLNSNIKSIANDKFSTVSSASMLTTPTPKNQDDINNKGSIINTNTNENNNNHNATSLGTLERRIRHKSSLSASSSTAIVGVGNEIYPNNELQQQQPLQTQNQISPSVTSQTPVQTQAQTSSSQSEILLQNINGTSMDMEMPIGISGINNINMRMNMQINGINGINGRNFDDNASVYSASSLPSAMNMTVMTQTPVNPSSLSSRLNNLQNLSLTYELKDFNYPLEEQFFILSFSSLTASYSCFEMLKMTFDIMKNTSSIMDNPDFYQLVLDCSGPLLDNTKLIVDKYYEEFLKCVNYEINTNANTNTNDNNNIDGNGNVNGNVNNVDGNIIDDQSNTTTTNDDGIVIPIKNITLNTTSILNPKATDEDHRVIYEDSIEYIHSLIQYTIIIREMTQYFSFNRNVIGSLQKLTKSTKSLVKYCSK
jgi:hypothetical protein